MHTRDNIFVYVYVYVYVYVNVQCIHAFIDHLLYPSKVKKHLDNVCICPVAAELATHEDMGGVTQVKST